MADRVRKKRFYALLAALAVFMTALPSNILAQSGAKVVEVAVAGNANINTDAVANAIALKPGDEYSESVVDKDKAAIMALGYFSVVTVHRQDVDGGIKVTYEVTENPKISAINITGNDPIPAETILGVMRTQPGQVLSVPTLNQDIGRIQEFYGEKGYVVYVEEVQVDPQTNALNIPIVVHRVESVEITGNKKTKTYVFLREMKTQPGTVFNRNTFRDDLMRIYNLDILEYIKEYEINPGSEVGLIKITLPVVEKKTGQVSLGFGYSSRQRLVGQAKLQETNFQGKGQGLNLLWEQGTSSNAVGGNASYEVSFFEPWIDRHHTSLNVSLYNKLQYRFSSGVFGSGSTFADDQFYSERRKGGDVTVSRPLSDNLRLYLGGKFENVDANPALLRNADQSLSNLVNIVQTGDVASGSVRLVHNTRDQDIDPASGLYNAISFELGTVDVTEYTDRDASGNIVANPIAIPFSGGYQKTAIDVRRYFSSGGPRVNPQDKRTTIAVRLRAGVGSGKMPYFEQFFVGGSESLRGYKEDRFWGTRMLVASVEYRRPVSQGLTGVLFVDYGDAWGTASSFSIPELPQHNGFEGNLGAGIGMRVQTPIGNIRLDYGVGSEGARTHFSMGHAF